MTMKNFASLLMLFGLGLFAAVGCTDEQQLENAQDELQEEQLETAETIDEAEDYGVVTTDEAEEITEEQGETVEQAGEVAAEAGDLIEEETDN